MGQVERRRYLCSVRRVAHIHPRTAATSLRIVTRAEDIARADSECLSVPRD